MLARTAAAHAHRELVERRRRRVDERVAGERLAIFAFKYSALARHCRPTSMKPLLAEHAHADRHRERQRPVVRADVAGRPLAADVLLARREREHVAALAVLVDRLAARGGPGSAARSRAPSRHAKRPASGPPNCGGMPSACPSPTAMSAPSAPGDSSSASANGSAVAVTSSAPCACASSAIASRRSTQPKKFG